MTSSSRLGHRTGQGRKGQERAEQPHGFGGAENRDKREKIKDGLGPGSWSGRDVIGCEILLSISCDTRVKI